MGERIEFDYYYGAETEQFSFYRIPRLLIKDEYFRELSTDAKLLYGLMLDRMALSQKNGWFDEENRAYIIYTIENIREDLGCGKEKAMKVLAELDTEKGIGLIERWRRGLGRPDIIYVKNFVVSSAKIRSSNSDTCAEVGKTDFKKSQNTTSRSRKTDFLRAENPTSAIRKNKLQEGRKSDFRKSGSQTGIIMIPAM